MRSQKRTDAIRGATATEIAAQHGFVLEYVDLGKPVLKCACCVTRTSSARLATFDAEQPLNVLKRALIKHEETALHKKSAKEAALEAEHQRKAAAAGYNVGRAAYFGYKENHPFRGFERQLQVLDMSGCNIGDLNHGRDFAADLLPHVYNVIKHDVRSLLQSEAPELGGRRRPFAVNADKATMGRRTGHFVGVMTIDKGEIKAIMLADEIVGPGGSTADKLVDGILAVLSDFMPEGDLRQVFCRPPTCIPAAAHLHDPPS